MTVDSDPLPVEDFLACPTPPAWVAWAADNRDLLLADHANCEKKAASTAMNMMYRYVEHAALLTSLSRLAREELRHFEQVVALMGERGIAYPQISASRYAGELRRAVRSHEPARLVDMLLVGAVIEARSCERFAALAPAVDADLGAFYRSLVKSEARHYRDYLDLAVALGSADEVARRLPEFLRLERSLIESPDTDFRLHSGVPA